MTIAVTTNETVLIIPPQILASETYRNSNLCPPTPHTTNNSFVLRSFEKDVLSYLMSSLLSWVATANGHPDFPIQNLPHGVFSPPGQSPRGGVAIGDFILDLRAACDANLFAPYLAPIAEAAAAPTLNRFLAMGPASARALRARLTALLSEGATTRPTLHDAAACTLHLPVRIGDYTDFYAGIHHARTVGTLFRPDAPLLPNYKFVPIGYHGRASSVRPSGVPVRRPSGQTRPPANDPAAPPRFGPSRNLDFELELGIWVGPGNAPGAPIPIADVADHIAGYCLLNDWSARDIQAWEYQPLGPFLAKSFATTISPWIVTAEALAPFRIPQPARPAGDPQPLPYLCDDIDQLQGALALTLTVWLLTPRQRAAGEAPALISSVTADQLYWTAAQLLTHHTSNGCDMRPGDLLGTGTISGPGAGSQGSLLEITRQGQIPLALPNGETRRYLEDGDEIIFRARAQREGAVPIGFGRCSAVLVEAK
jgi:fumarylacetoacetase